MLTVSEITWNIDFQTDYRIMWCNPETFDAIDISNIDGVGDLEVTYIYYSDGYINMEVSIEEDDPIIKKIKSKYEWLQTKTVPDSDGFDTEYSWYRNIDTGIFVFVLGDSEMYNPDEDEHDFETDSYDEAYEWFTNYHGFEEDDNE